MAAQPGSSFLIKLGDGGSPSEAFASVAGLRTKSLKINHETVDVTNADSTGKWRELLEDAGIRSVSVTGSGVFFSGTASDDVNTIAVDGSINNWQVIVPGLGMFAGPFQVTDMEYAGEHNGEATWTLTLESAGALTYTADS